jgi:hypothetical protein
MVPIKRSHTALAIGLRGGDLRTLNLKRSTESSRSRAKMLSRSWSRLLVARLKADRLAQLL